MATLEAAGTAQNRKVYARHGVSGEAFGVSYAELGKLKKAIKTDHDLARELWATGNHDARVLATQVADAKAATPAELDSWAGEADSYVAADAVARLVERTPIAREMVEAWVDSAEEMRARIAWSAMARLAMDGAFTHEEAMGRIEQIEREIHQRPNRVRDAMLGALAGFGLASEELAEEAKAAVGRIGPVNVDHGETGCKNPDVVRMVDNGWERKRKKAAK
jgi:3-methyladenine DNA glycosylase AlkD